MKYLRNIKPHEVIKITDMINHSGKSIASKALIDNDHTEIRFFSFPKGESISFKPGFRIDLHIKDLGNVLDTAHGVGAPLPLTSSVMEMMQALKVDGLGQKDHSSLVKYYEKLANAQVVRKGN